ncbi:hypothetical protein EV426DRAFT_107452 [Tirmania nivea]|nr:hypothetical protein EV426DRAFT_107452 [Tirmania nivea]
MEEGDLRVIENGICQEMKLAEGQVTAVAMEYCVKQIAFGGKDVIQVYHILPKQVCNCPKHCHQFYGLCLRPHAGVFLPDRLVPTWMVALRFIPRTILMVPLAARDRPIIDQCSKSVILPWYNTIYDPQQASAIPTAPLPPSGSRRLQPLLSKEWPICLVRPHKYEWLDRLQAAEIYSNPYKLRDYVDWNGKLLDKHLFRWYNQNPLECPIATFGGVSHHQFTNFDQKLRGWRETVKLLPCMVITKCPVDDANSLWSKDGIRRQQLRCQMIFESREVHSTDDRGVATMEEHHCLSFGRLVPLPACDDVGGWNIKEKKVNDGQRKTLRILHHAVAHLRLPNTFLVAAVYEDNAIYLFEVAHQRGFEKIDNASQTPWDREWSFYGVKVGYFGATVPRGAGLGSVKGKILSIAFDVRDWLEPGPRWPEERRKPDAWDGSWEWMPCIWLRKPSGVALVVLVDGEEMKGEVLPEETLPLVTESGGIPPIDPIAEDLRREEREREVMIQWKDSTKGTAANNSAKMKSSVPEVSPVKTPGKGKALTVKPLTDGAPGFALGAAGPSNIVVKANVEGTTAVSTRKPKVMESASRPITWKLPRLVASKKPPKAFNRRTSRLMSPPPFQMENSDSSSNNDSVDQDQAHPSVHFDPPEELPPLRHPQKPRFVVHTIHLYQGHNKNVESGNVADPRGANWEYVGLPKKVSAMSQLRWKTGKAKARIYAKRHGNWAEYNRLYVGNHIDKAARIDENQDYRNLILSQGGRWAEGKGFQRCIGRVTPEGEGLGIHVIHEGPGLDRGETQQRRIDLEIDRDYGGDLAIGSMGIAGDIGMGRLMGNEADIVPPGMGVGAYRKLKALTWHVPSAVKAGMGPPYNKRTFEYHRKKTTAEIMKQLRPVGGRQAAENMLRDAELATDEEIVGVMKDLHAPGLERKELGSLIALGGATVGSGELQLAPDRVNLQQNEFPKTREGRLTLKPSGQEPFKESKLFKANGSSTGRVIHGRKSADT